MKKTPETDELANAICWRMSGLAAMRQRMAAKLLHPDYTDEWDAAAERWLEEHENEEIDRIVDNIIRILSAND